MYRATHPWRTSINSTVHSSISLRISFQRFPLFFNETSCFLAGRKNGLLFVFFQVGQDQEGALDFLLYSSTIPLLSLECACVRGPRVPFLLGKPSQIESHLVYAYVRSLALFPPFPFCNENHPPFYLLIQPQHERSRPLHCWPRISTLLLPFCG